MDHRAFAQSWADGWNTHDLDAIMSHYRDDIVFHSLKAKSLTGAGELHGKEALRAYWSAALARQPELEFSVQDVFEGHNMMIISYLNHRGVLASEVLYFDAAGKVYRAAACHRATQAPQAPL
jgi:ketosteroid isomerase-like protein